MADEGFKRKLTAILSADAAGYSRLMAEDETATVKTIASYREIMASLIKQHRGRVVDSPGDNLLAEFSSVVDAVQCAVAVQNEIQTQNAELPDNRRMEFRIGINLGDVIDEKGRIYGDGVNISARLEALADPGGICVSKTAFDQIETKLPLGYEYLGEQSVKNIPKPIGAYRVLMKPDAAGKVIGEKRFLGRHSRRTAMAAIIILVMVVGGLVSWNIYIQRSKKVEPAAIEKMAYPLPDKPSIAVLPFDNMSDDPDQEYFSDGLTKEIITALSKTPKLFVIAPNSMFTYKGNPVKIRHVSEELGVRYVLEGSVRKEKKRLRINVQLIDAVAGRNIWAERYERDLRDLFPLQDEITKKILIGLHIKLTEGEHTRLWAKGTDNIEAYLKFLQGREYLLRYSKDGIILGRQSLNEAIGIDPDYGIIYAFMGWSYLLEVSWGWSKSRKDDLSRAYEMAQKALSLDAPKEDVYALLSGIRLREGKIEETIDLREKAVSLNPNHAVNNALLATAMTFGGRSEEAVEIFKKAIRLDPIPPLWFLHYLGSAYRVIGEYEKAIAMFKAVLKRDPEYWLSHWSLAACYGLLNREEEAEASAAEVLRIRPKFSLTKTMGFPYKDKADKKLVFAALQKAGLK
jgi:adenylate cyclase